MGIFGLLFYALAAVTLLCAVLAVIRKNMVHAVLLLVLSFLAAGMLFFLLGAPLLGILEVIVYAGAIMVLFLFIVMMIRTDTAPTVRASRGRYAAAAGTGLVYAALWLILAMFSGPDAKTPMTAAAADPASFGRYLFARHWLAVEIVSLLLLAALVGALHLGLRPGVQKPEKGEGP